MYTYMMVKIAYLCGRNYENSAYVLFRTINAYINRLIDSPKITVWVTISALKKIFHIRVTYFEGCVYAVLFT